MSSNYIHRVVSAYEAWSMGRELGEDEVMSASRLLGTPTRKVNAFIDRYAAVFGKLIEERCSDTDMGRVCIYTWSRRAYKRYFPAALDAGGTILWFPEPGRVEILSNPLHRALDLGVHGVGLPSEGLVAVTPRLDGWQVNLYYDRVLGRWAFSTRYVLHNMRFERGKLVVEEYGSTINPLVETAERLASKLGLYSRLEGLEGWTLTFMVLGPEPATAVRSLPDPEFYEDYRLLLVAARDPDGRLLQPYSGELAGLAGRLGVESLVEQAVRGLSVEEARGNAESGLEHPSLFLWFERGEPGHQEYYEVKSLYYEEYVNATKRMDAKSLVVLLTSGDERVARRVEEALGDVAREAYEAIRDLEEALREAGPEALKALEDLEIPRKAIRDSQRALAEGRIQRALRVLCAHAVQGLSAGEVADVLRALASRLREGAG